MIEVEGVNIYLPCLGRHNFYEGSSSGSEKVFEPWFTDFFVLAGKNACFIDGSEVPDGIVEFSLVLRSFCIGSNRVSL